MTRSPATVCPATAPRHPRRRRVTTPLPVGPFGLPPFALEPITALRFRRRGFSIALDPTQAVQVLGRGHPPEVDVHLPFPSLQPRHVVLHRRPELPGHLYWERVGGHCKVGTQRGFEFFPALGVAPISRADVLCLGDVEVMALGKSAHALEGPVARRCGRDAYAVVDEVLAAAERFSPLVIEGATRDAHALAELLHHGTQKRAHPFFVPGALGRRAREIDALLREADCGTVFVREQVLASAPAEFLAALLDRDDYHLWPIFVVDSERTFWQRLDHLGVRGAPARTVRSVRVPHVVA